jgi:4-deoxy-L-threo-5-hexosulose-uronate ketol-isomerase
MKMELRHASSPDGLADGTTDDLRRRYLLESLLVANEIRAAYLYQDRLVVGGAVPIAEPLPLTPDGPIRSPSFLTGRELGILHVGGGRGVIRVADEVHQLDCLDMLYLGCGDRTVRFESEDPRRPARFYFVSARAHRTCGDRLVRRDQVQPVELGDDTSASRRHLYRVIHPDHVETASLLMGYTQLVPGSVWNTMPPHLHDRRTEVYFYFDLPDGERVFHFMGQPRATRHLVVANEQAVLSPPWSIHSGVGTAAYAFCWAMAGENTSYTDLDVVPTADLR